MCGDYRRLNTVTTPDRYSIPLIADLTSRLQGKKFFGKVDLVKGYHQIPVAEQDIAKTAITTPFGTYEFLRMPFGLKNAGQTFQRMMDEILSDLDYLFVYMDDVLVASRSMEEHLEHFRETISKADRPRFSSKPGQVPIRQKADRISRPYCHERRHTASARKSSCDKRVPSTVLDGRTAKVPRHG